MADPRPYLNVSFELKKEDSMKPYDPKKSVWVPDGEGGFHEALIQEARHIIDYFDLSIYIMSLCMFRPKVI